HARIEEDEIANFDAECPHVVGVEDLCIEPYFHGVFVARRGGNIPVDVGAGVDRQHGSTITAVVVSANGHALELHCLPHETADHGGLQPSVAFDFLDHQAKCVHVRRKTARGGAACAGKREQQCAFAR